MHQFNFDVIWYNIQLEFPIIVVPTSQVWKLGKLLITT